MTPLGLAAVLAVAGSTLTALVLTLRFLASEAVQRRAHALTLAEKAVQTSDVKKSLDELATRTRNLELRHLGRQP